MAIPLLAAVDKPRRLLADKAYDADSFRNWLKRRKIKAVIQSTATRRTPYPLDQKTYRRRNVIERMFCKLKNWRRIAPRYDRRAQNYPLRTRTRRHHVSVDLNQSPTNSNRRSALLH